MNGCKNHVDVPAGSGQLQSTYWVYDETEENSYPDKMTTVNLLKQE